VAEEVRASWPAEKPLFVRISAVDDCGWNIEDSIALARRLRSAGVDVIDCSTGGLANASHIDVSRKLTYGYQVPHAHRIRTGAEIATMAVGLIIHADHAEKILREGSADLVALGREMLHNPNWTIDAAQKLGVEPRFAHVPAPYGYWLEKRARSSFGGRPSTWQMGMEPEGDPAAGG
jgi:2,4-dienoyl-CoA reductase-like NADH-dependent reductase (Old Yellow Enzyme family)